ncbi:MAG: PIG-L deacetylase family protein [bacterium]
MVETPSKYSQKKPGTKILAISPHPDDIEFGCGGTLLRYGQAGSELYQLILTDGCVGGDPVMRKREQEKASKILNVKRVFWAGYHDTELVDGGDLIRKIEEILDTVRPEVVLVNYPEDSHQDHRAAALAVIAATRNIKEVLFYESPTSMHFEPDIFVDITDFLDEKVQLLELHASQIKKTNIENLKITEIAKAYATFRGVQGRVRHAEGFRGLRVLRSVHDRMYL